MGVPSCCLCWLHNSGVSTPSVFSQSKNTLGPTLNQLEISFPRPNLKAIFSLFPLSLPNLHTDSYITVLVKLLALRSRLGSFCRPRRRFARIMRRQILGIAP